MARPATHFHMSDKPTGLSCGMQKKPFTISHFASQLRKSATNLMYDVSTSPPAEVVKPKRFVHRVRIPLAHRVSRGRKLGDEWEWAGKTTFS